MNKGRFFLIGVLAFVAANLFAAKDPISWKLNQPFPETVLVADATYSVQYTLRNELPFTLVKPLVISKAASSTEFSYNDQCTGKKLKPGEICTVGINLTPRIAGPKTIYIIIEGYDKNQVPLPTLVTTATENTGVIIEGRIVTSLPPTMEVNQSADYTFQFTNNGTSSATGVFLSSNQVNFSTTCGPVLAPGASCVATGSFTPTSTIPALQSVIVTFDFTQGTPVIVQNSTTVSAAQSALLGQVLVALPDVTIPNNPYQVIFQYANTSGNPITVTQQNTYPASFTETNNTCPNNAALDGGSTCQITGIFNSANTGNFDVVTQLTPAVGLPVRLETSTSVVNPGDLVGVLTQGLPAETVINTNYPITFTFSNTSNLPVGITQNNTFPVAFSGITNNCPDGNNPLAAGSSCTITGTFNSAATGAFIVTASLVPNNASFNTVTLTTDTTVSNTQTALTGQLIQGLPDPTIQNQPYPIQFQFTNTTGAPIPISQQNTFPPQFIVSNNACPSNGNPLAGGASCVITGTFQSSTLGAFTVTAQLTDDSVPNPVPVSTATNVVPISDAGRTIFFSNQCNFPVWISLNGANRPNSQGANIPCTQDSDCPTGSSCNPNASGGTGQCFWKNYLPADGNLQLSSGNTTSIVIPDANPANPAEFLWSGAISASTGCSNGSCVTANCGNQGGVVACSPGVGFGQPATQAEFTFEKGTVDTYDIEVINGFHIPIQVTPNAAVPDGYSCGEPGNPNDDNFFSACNWDGANPPNENYNWVSSGGPACSSSSPGCLCGLDIGLNKVCGKFLGYWTANQACGVNATKANQYFNCNQVLSAPFPANTYTLVDLYGCKTPNASQPLLNSCYRAGANNTCCGCANWGAFVNLPPTTQLCGSQSTQWVGSVQSTLLWIKQACSNYYTYPFDDASSTFTCQNAALNTQNYTITFCPGSTTGLPSGATDGRPG